MVIGAIVILVVLVIVIGGSFRIVPQGSVGLVQRLGRYHREATPGLAVKIPLVDSVKLISTKSVTVSLAPEPVITADNVSPVIDAYFIYQVVDAKRFLYEIQNPELAIKNMVSSTLRSEVGQRKLAEVMTHREQINTKLRAELDESTTIWGIKILQASIRQVDLSKEMQMAMESQKKADANKLAAIEQAQGQKEAAILQAEGARQAAIAQAEGEKTAIVLRSEGSRQSRMLEAEGEAGAIQRLAQAQADALRLVNQAVLALAQSADDEWRPERIQAVLQFKSLDALTTLGQGPATKIVIPAELSGLTGILSSLRAASDEPGGKDQ
ncbi:MAG: SPFH/Band 7/PHB domain protein [Thermaerobacter sp.]|nr:SPFH/Band 7/PHB domain protein [Thermaerobacter sp.]